MARKQHVMQYLKENVCCAQEGPEKRDSALGQCCVYKDASKRIIHSSTSKPPASIAEIQGAHIIKKDYRTIF
jgi:hypothetical protein